jgi:hypothetical protein
MNDTTKSKVYLDMDQPIRGQRYACISFLSPEDIVLTRELFDCHHFLRDVGNDVANMFQNLEQCVADDKTKNIIKGVQERYAYLSDPLELLAYYKTFKAQHADRLDNEFMDQNGGLTSVRALKIRGVYDTIEEARDRCNDLRDFDKGMFNIYVAQVGCWLPWSPNPDEIADSVYSDNQLNLLMQRYRENNKVRDKLYQDRMHDLQPVADAKTGITISQTETPSLDDAPIVSESGKVFF